MMDHLWTPWRSTYITSKHDKSKCIFCEAAALRDADEEKLVIHRATSCFVLLNRYPYSSGHLMIAPYQHVSRLGNLDEAVTAEMMRLARVAEDALAECYSPHGINFGLNLGEAAGAGIEQHLHMHALPRWKGDANFMTTVANTRVIPESLGDTYTKLKESYARLLPALDNPDAG